jgi:hypothetical protein
VPIIPAFAPGDVVVGEYKGENISGIVVEFDGGDSAMVKIRMDSRDAKHRTRPFCFDGMTVEMRSPKISLKNQVKTDQYKEFYGSHDMFYDSLPYYPRVIHSLYGDIAFGRVITYQGKRSIIAGVTDSHGKRWPISVIMCTVEDKVLFLTRLQKGLQIDGPKEFCSSTESSMLMELLSGKKYKTRKVLI